MTLHVRNWEKVFQGGQGFSPEVISLLTQLEQDLAALVLSAGVLSVASDSSGTVDVGGTATDPTVGLHALGSGSTGPIGDGTHVPVVTIDKYGRVTALTSNSITGGGGGGLTPTGIKTANYTAVAGDMVLVDASGGNVKITLPVSRANGDTIGIYALAAIPGTGIVTVEDATGGGIGGNGQVDFFLYDADDALVVQYNTTFGAWVVTQTAYGQGVANVLKSPVIRSKTANYSAQVGELVLCDTATTGAFTVTLPSAPQNGSLVYVYHWKQSSARTVTVQRGGSDVIRYAGSAASTSFTLQTQDEGVTLQYVSGGTGWVVLNRAFSLTALDLRYQLVGATAGGDLTGTYPNPTLAAAGPGATGPIGDATHAPAVTIDAKGRVTALTSVAITGTAPGGSAGGDLAGTYPNPTVAALAITNAKVSASAAIAYSKLALTGSILEADLSTSDVTTANVSSTKHGFAPKSPADATQFLNGAATPAFAAVKDSDLSTSDITTNNVTSTKHGFAPKSPADATQFLNGAATPAFAAVKDSDLSTSDITTNNVSTSKHGFVPKAPNSGTQFLRDDGTWATPAGGSADKLGLTPTAVKTANYTAVAGDFVPVDTTSGAITVTLPTAPTDGSVVAVKHVTQGGTNVVTVNTAGSDVYNKTGGGTSATLTLLSQALLLQYKSSGAIWYVIADDIPLSGMDARFVSPTGTTTLTNKRVTKRVTATSGPGATPTINTDNCDVVNLTALAAAITSMTTNLTGTPVDGDTLRISFTDNGTARAITWGASFEASTVALPTTTVISTRLDAGFVWNTATSKWRCVGVA